MRKILSTYPWVLFLCLSFLCSCNEMDVFSGPRHSRTVFTWDLSGNNIIGICTYVRDDPSKWFVFRMNLQGNYLSKNLINPKDPNIFQNSLILSPDNDRFYFQDSKDIVLISSQTGAVSIINSLSDYVSASPSGMFVFTSSQSSYFQLNNYNNGNLLRLNSFGPFKSSLGYYEPIFITDSIWYITKSAIVVPGDSCVTSFFDVDGNNIFSDGCIEPLKYISSSHSIGCITTDDSLIVVDLLSKTIRSIRKLTDYSTVLLSSDGDKLYYTSGSETNENRKLKALDIATGKESVLAYDVRSKIVLSPDESKIAYFTIQDYDISLRIISVK